MFPGVPTGTPDVLSFFVSTMGERKFIEINVKNKEHRACCGTINALVIDVDNMHKGLLDLQSQIDKTNVPVNTKKALEKKIADIDHEHKELLQKAEMCGCF